VTGDEKLMQLHLVPNKDSCGLEFRS